MSYVLFVLIYKISFGFDTKDIKCARQNINAQHFKTTVSYIFSKYVHFEMRFLVEK